MLPIKCAKFFIFIFRYGLRNNEISNVSKEYLKQYPNLTILYVALFFVSFLIVIN